MANTTQAPGEGTAFTRLNSRTDRWSFLSAAHDPWVSAGLGQLVGPSAPVLDPTPGLHQSGGGVLVPHSPAITE